MQTEKNIYYKEELEELIKQKELYIATIVHDLKNPIQAQVISLKMLRNENLGILNDKQKELIDIILESCNYLKQLLKTMLEVYKLETGVVKLNNEDINIDKLIQNSIKEIAAFSSYKKVSIEYVNTIKNQIISADKILIRRVISNLLNNGINYSKMNSQFKIELEEDSERIYLKFISTGYIIPEEVRSHIFDKYVTSQGLTHRTGTGLGLYYCKKALELHNAKIYLVSHNENNEFIIEFQKTNNILPEKIIW